MTRTISTISNLNPGDKFYFKGAIITYTVSKIEQKGQMYSVWHDKGPHALVEKGTKAIIVIT